MAILWHKSLQPTSKKQEELHNSISILKGKKKRNNKKVYLARQTFPPKLFFPLVLCLTIRNYQKTLIFTQM